MIESIGSNALAAYGRFQERIDAAGSRLARGEGGDTRFVQDVVELKSSEAGAAAALKVLKVADELTGSLLDLLA